MVVAVVGIEYLEQIDQTLAPYGGRFLVHGGKLTPAEGDWTGEVVLVEFPDSDAATAWYASPAYQEILPPLRTEHSTSMAALLEGVPDGYRVADKIGELLGG